MEPKEPFDYDKKFQQIWAMFEETAKLQKEQQQRWEQTQREEQQQRELANKEWADLRRIVAAVSRNVGGLNNSMGELIETLFGARLWEKFEHTPYKLERAYKRYPVFNGKKQITEIDILLSDTDYAMAVEVKMKPDINDVKDHLQRMEDIKEYPPKEIIGKKLLGAMAGGIFNPNAKDFAFEKGLYVLEVNADTVSLAPPPEGFVPKFW